MAAVRGIATANLVCCYIGLKSGPSERELGLTQSCSDKERQISRLGLRGSGQASAC